MASWIACDTCAALGNPDTPNFVPAEVRIDCFKKKGSVLEPVASVDCCQTHMLDQIERTYKNNKKDPAFFEIRISLVKNLRKK